MKELVTYFNFLHKSTVQQLQAERRLTRKLNQLFGSLFDRLPNHIENLGLQDQQQLRRLIRNHFYNLQDEYIEVLRDEGQGIAQLGANRTVHHLQSAGLSVGYDDVSQKIINMMEQATFQASRITLDRMTGDVMGTLQQGIQQGFGVEQTLDLLRNDFKRMEEYELRRIARTELNNYANRASYETEKEFGVEFHQWISADDENVRGNDPSDKADHMELHLQITRVGHRFSNGLRYPGDKEGALEEIINCRCRVVPFLMPPNHIAPMGKRFFYEDDIVSRKSIKGGAGSGNWGHEGQAGSWGGSSETGGTSEEFLNVPGEIRHSFNPDTGEFDEERHLKHCSELEGLEYSDYMTELENYVDSQEDMGFEDMRAIPDDVTQNDVVRNMIDISAIERNVEERIENQYGSLAHSTQGAYLLDKYDLREDEDVMNFTFESYDTGAYYETEHQLHMADSNFEDLELKKATQSDGWMEVLDKLEEGNIDTVSEAKEEIKKSLEVEFPNEAEVIADHYEQVVSQLIEDRVGDMFTKWKKTSGDHDEDAIAVQLAVQEHFGLQDAKTDHFSSLHVGGAKEILSKHGDGIKKILDAQYKETQEVLAEEGISKVYAYRGMSFTSDRMIGDKDLPEDLSHIDFTEETRKVDMPIDFQSQPLSSFSTSASTASDFTKLRMGDLNMIVASEVPAERVFSISSTGFGSSGEEEVTILGENTRGDAIVKQDKTGIHNHPHSYLFDEEGAKKDIYDNPLVQAIKEVLSIKGGQGSGNWGHTGQEGEWGGSSETGGTSEAFLEKDPEIRHSLDPETGEYDPDRHFNRMEELSAEEEREYCAKLYEELYGDYDGEVSEEYLEVPEEARPSFDPETGEYDHDRHEIYRDSLDREEWSEYSFAVYDVLEEREKTREREQWAEEYKEIPDEIKDSFDPETGEYDFDSHYQKMKSYYEDAETQEEFQEAHRMEEEYKEKVDRYRAIGEIEPVEFSPEECVTETGEIDKEKVEKTAYDYRKESYKKEYDYKMEVLDKAVSERDKIYQQKLDKAREELEPVRPGTGREHGDLNVIPLPDGDGFEVQYDLGYMKSEDEIKGEASDMLREYLNKETYKEQHEYLHNEVIPKADEMQKRMVEGEIEFDEAMDYTNLKHALNNIERDYDRSASEISEALRDELVRPKEEGIKMDYWLGEEEHDFGDQTSYILDTNYRMKEGKKFIEKYASSDLNEVDMEVVPIPEGGRSSCTNYATEGYSKIKLAEYADLETAVHEIAHAINHQNEGVEMASDQLFSERTEGKEISKIFTNAEGNDEMGYRGAFMEHYTGKVYENRERQGVEVVSMGMQHLYSEPVTFYDRDPEHFKFMVGVLEGVF